MDASVSFAVLHVTNTSVKVSTPNKTHNNYCISIYNDILLLNTKCLLCILEIPHSNFAWRPAIITRHPCGGFLNLSKVYAPLQTVRRRSIYSMHFWSFPSYIQKCFQQKICTLFMKFTSFHHTKFHTQTDGSIIIITNFSRLFFFNFNVCWLKKERKKKHTWNCVGLLLCSEHESRISGLRSES